LKSTLKTFVGRYHHLTLTYRVSLTTVANDIWMPWYCYHEYFSFYYTTLETSWRVSHAEQEMLTFPEYHISPLVFIEVYVVLSFVSSYIM